MISRGIRGHGLPRVASAAVLLLCVLARPATAHPAPFSYLDLRVRDGGIDGTLVVHVIDLAHDLDLPALESLLDRAVAERQRDRMFTLLAGRLSLEAGGRRTRLELTALEPLPERQAIRFSLRFGVADVPGVLVVRAALFPYDPNHQTFVNVYERDTLVQQNVLDRKRAEASYFRGTAQGRLALVGRFVGQGIHHIVIGPDHVLFLVGLLLLGGRFVQLVKIVTAFTLAHSLTLSLAALDVMSPSGRIVEPAIALSIVYVGADNLLVAKGGRDVRAWIALAFGLIHGFGFAGVLKEIGLPPAALGWSLFSFNVGVEIGQIAIVVAMAGLLEAVRRHSEVAVRRIAVAGSVVVVAAGAWWFVERVFLSGGVS